MAVEVSSPSGTIKSRLNAARKRLAGLLRPQLGVELPERLMPAPADTTERRDGRG